MYPLKFHPVYKERVWGGNKLKSFFDKEIDEHMQVGESWEICAHSEGMGLVKDGVLKGKSIIDLIREKREEILGKNTGNWQEQFPLLIKFIDANEKLSVQVHPQDDYGSKYEKEMGKTEMWYVIDVRPQGKLVYGLKNGITKEDFSRSIKNYTIENTLNEIAVKPGDVLFIPSGTIHAIGDGILIAEIQQNSDTTYRVFDWNRLGLDGKPRELHVEKALDVIDFKENPYDPIIKGLTLYEEGYKRTIYVSCIHFTVEVLDIYSIYEGLLDGERFEIFTGIEGDFKIQYKSDQFEILKKGETVLMPAHMGSFNIEGEGKIIRTYITDPSMMVEELMKKEFSLTEIYEIRGL